MNVAGLVMGILSIMGMFVAFIPFLGWMNWGIIPFAVVGLVVSIVGVAVSSDNRGAGVAGIILCAIAILGGGIRLIIGCGII